MTIQETVLDLLQFIGVNGFSAVDGANALNRPGLDTQDVNKALAAINSALQEIQKFGPKSLKETERAAYFYDPTIVYLTTDATQAQSITLVSPPAWIPGCSILIDGDGDLNRVVDVTGNQVSLLRGYRGPTATDVKATIYADCLLLPDDITSVVEPVQITPNRRLTRARDLAEFLRFTPYGYGYDTIGYGGYPWSTLEYGMGPSKVSGVPSLYYVESRQKDRLLYMRLNPMPSSRGNVTYQAKLAPERVSANALALDGGADPGIPFTSIPERDQESLLLPLARWRFFAHPALKNSESRQSVKLEYDEAMLYLRNGMAYETASGGATRASYI